MSVPQRNTTKAKRSVPRKRSYLPADDRRAQILGVAREVFSRRGYHLANVADICKAARIGRGTLYQYFDNKRDVMLAVMEDLATRVKRFFDERRRLEAIPGAARAPVEIIVRFTEKRMRELLDVIFADEATLRLVLREARGLDGALDQIIARIDKIVLHALEDDLRAAQKMGLLRAGNLKLAARYLLGGVEKLVLLSLAEDEPVDLDAIVKVAVELELFGLLAANLGANLVAKQEGRS